MNQKVAVGYIRVSTEEQTLNYSLDYQEEHIQKYCEEEDIILKDIYNEGFGSGGTVDDRPEFLRMIGDVLTDEKINYVIVLADHRFARDHADAINMLKRLRQKEKNLICIADHINTENPNDYEYFLYKSIHSERQRREINFNCMYGMRQRAKEGWYSGGKVTGYYMVNGKLKADPDRKEIVHEIFDKCANEKWGFKKIAKYLNTIGYKTVNGEEFDINAVKTILSNPIYIGKIRFEDKIYDGKHKPMISKKIWDKAQENLKQRSYMPEKIHPGSYFLAGLLKCPECGSSMVHHKSSGGKYQYYQCLASKNGKSCGANLVGRQYAEDTILTEITSIINSPSISKILYDKLNSKILNSQKTIEKSIANTKSEIERKEKQISKTYELYYKTNSDFHLKQIEKLGNQQKGLNEAQATSLLNLDSLKQIDTKEIVNELLENFRKHFHSLETSKQKELLQAIIQEIHVSQGQKPKDRKITEIVYHVTKEEIASLLL